MPRRSAQVAQISILDELTGRLPWMDDNPREKRSCLVRVAESPSACLAHLFVGAGTTRHERMDLIAPLKRPLESDVIHDPPTVIDAVERAVCA